MSTGTATKTETTTAISGGILGPTIAGIGFLVAAISGIVLIFEPLAATTLVAGAVLLVGGLAIYQLALNGSKQERDMTELMELMTDLN